MNDPFFELLEIMDSPHGSWCLEDYRLPGGHSRHWFQSHLDAMEFVVEAYRAESLNETKARAERIRANPLDVVEIAKRYGVNL